ncbi:MAG TPA: C45 family autoproteolytic acyltransferase/hydrolase [Spirochaetota bacterium]|nr:C45 family autoproteolytic acyltransferase/hydrolase [Spirochaetota bacterium]
MKPAYLAPLILIFIAGCVGASTFGMNEDVYQRTLASLKDRMVSLEVNKIDFTGSPGETGKQKAELLQQQPRLHQVLKDLLSLSRVKKGDPEKVKLTLQKYFPSLQKELQAFAEYSPYSEDDVYSFAGAHFAIGSCTILLRSGRHPLLARNYDWAPTLVDGILAAHKGMSTRFASLSMTASIFGAYSGINEKGLSIAIAGISSNRNYHNPGGLSIPVIVRGVLERAADVDSAVRILKQVPHTTPVNYALADKSGNIAVVEVSPPKVVVRKDHSSKGFLTAANHFQSLDNKEEGVSVMPNSKRRVKAVEGFQACNPDAGFRDVLNFMGRVKNGPAMENYSLMMGTLWSIVYLPQSCKMIIRVGLKGEPFMAGFSERAPLKIKGTIKDRPPELKDYF